MTNQVLHADFIALDPAISAGARAGLIEAARSLSALDEVLFVCLLEGEPDADFDLVLFFLLRDFAALEPFGTDQRYSRFLQGSVAPVLKGLAGADVQLEAGFPYVDAHGACLALAAPPETYDWEVRDLLSGWAQSLNPKSSVIGLAAGERQRYRGLAVAFGNKPLAPALPAETRFGATLIAGKASVL